MSSQGAQAAIEPSLTGQDGVPPAAEHIGLSLDRPTVRQHAGQPAMDQSQPLERKLRRFGSRHHHAGTIMIIPTLLQSEGWRRLRVVALQLLAG